MLTPLWTKLLLIPLVGWATVLLAVGLVALSIAWRRWFPEASVEDASDGD